MPKFFKIFILAFILEVLLPFNTCAQNRVKNIVVFFSYGSNLPAFEKVLNGLNSAIRKNSNEPVNIITEYLDISRSAGDEYYPKFIISLYNDKLTKLTVDLLITVGPGANKALLKYGSNKLKDLKMINIDINLPGRTKMSELEITNGLEILLDFKPQKTLKHAFDLFPDHKEVYVISGVSPLDKYYTSLIAKNKNAFEADHRFKFISDLSIDSIIRFVPSLPKKSIVLIPAFLQDASRVSFSTPEVIEMISKHSPAPVFLSVTDGGFNAKCGSIGGFLFSYNNLGEEAGRIAHEILSGKQIKNIKVDDSRFYEYMYDWNELERWGLTDSAILPDDAVFYNRNLSFLQLYKWYIVGILAFVLSQTLLIFYLIRLNKRQKSITHKLHETEGMYRELVHMDRVSKMSLLTAALSHELFQPLAAIRLTAQAGKQLIQKEKFDAENASQMFDNILEDETRATKLIRSVKSLMKAESGDKGIVNLNLLLDETVALLGFEAKKNWIRIKVIFEANPVFVWGEKIQLQQVLMNFMRNASSAMEGNAPHDKLMEIILRLSTEEAILSVMDSGPGIDIATKEKLFQPFVSTKKEGFGIGLTLCKSLIEKHNGTIWAENTPGGGALFAFSLPLIKNN